MSDPGYLGIILFSCESEDMTIEDFINEFNF